MVNVFQVAQINNQSAKHKYVPRSASTLRVRQLNLAINISYTGCVFISNKEKNKMSPEEKWLKHRDQGKFTHYWFSPAQLKLIHEQVKQNQYCIIDGKKKQFTESLVTESRSKPTAHGLWHDYTYLGCGVFHSEVKDNGHIHQAA